MCSSSCANSAFVQAASSGPVMHAKLNAEEYGWISRDYEPRDESHYPKNVIAQTVDVRISAIIGRSWAADDRFGSCVLHQ
ncbi:hypothetical protein BN2475_190193 [Paraburkholderia ribeironis]|uniref:Uncharacterized protein n=1 Tax=Paraburkholderia ribeironis TaxID=1247936 RepID=A0A1N7RW84_9BURK|nr:hypothetical protein BN2475_190193 [Paraburkholderia ribeironis]